MNLKILSDRNLLEKTENLVKEERELLIRVLHCFDEIARRRLFSAHGYKSLFDMAVRHFHYSEDQAYRRISAMKLLRDVPAITDKVEAGEITLSHIGVAQSVIRHEKKMGRELSACVKEDLFTKIASKPIREAEKIALSYSPSPEAVRPDRLQAVADNLVELKFVVSADIEKKIETLKGRLAHKYPSLSLGELFDKLCDLGLEVWDAQGCKAQKTSKTATFSCRRPAPWRAKRCVTIQKSKSQVKRDVFARANHKCESCNSHYGLEIDHIVPRVRGGTSNESNLRVLCRSCNQRAAIEKLGLTKMEKFIT